MLACVVNISEGRDRSVLDALATTCGADLLDVHADPFHHRSVFTLVGVNAPRRLATAAVERLDLRRHEGVHPRLGVVDVVPFVPFAGVSDPGREPMAAGADEDEDGWIEARSAREAFMQWAAAALDVPCFRYGPERSLPEVRRSAWTSLLPDVGPTEPHPSAGAMCVGARQVLVAYNVWLAEPDPALARRIASEVRGPSIRALGLVVGDRVQVSMNLIDPDAVGPSSAYDLVAARADVAGAELVGLLPARVLSRITHERWSELDLSADTTIEARLARRR